MQSAKLINAVTDSEINIESNEKEASMCQAIRDMRAESERTGEQHGIVRAFAGLVEDGILFLNEAAARAHMSVDEFRSIRNELGV